jgi:CelD/BcsL family acetyltransferase involved in cellulose biosynthesis
MWVARYEDNIVAAGLIFTSSRFHAASWLTLADPGRLDLKPYEFLYYAMIMYYAREGYRYFDLNPSGGHEGVVKSKEKYGTVKLTSRLFRKYGYRDRVVEPVRSVLGDLGG